MNHPTEPSPATPPPSTRPEAVTPTPGPPAGNPSFRGLRLEDLQAAAREQKPWLWHGYLAPGNVTLLTSQAKAGKTTLVAVLLDRLKAGGELAGLPLRTGKAAVVSEEGPLHWYGRSQKLAFGDHLCWFCRPFRGKPRPDEWLALLDHLAGLRQQHGLDLVVIDPLAAFLPGRDENGAGGMLAGLMPLQRLTAEGVSVLVLHHSRKGESPAGQAARGSGALSGYVDIVVEMHWHGRPEDGERRRRLRAWSRHEETPRSLVIELTADGADYIAHGPVEEDEFAQGWQQLRAVLEGAEGKLTRREIAAQWPPGQRPPNEVTLWRWLERAVGEGSVRMDGSGRRNAPFRYWLPGQEEKWRQGPWYLPELPDLELLQEAEVVLKRRARQRRGS